MLDDSANVQPPRFGPGQPAYPPLMQCVRIYGAEVTQATYSGKKIYTGYVQQFVVGTGNRDREGCYVFEPNGRTLANGIYPRCRLIGVFSNLPLYETDGVQVSFEDGVEFRGSVTFYGKTVFNESTEFYKSATFEEKVTFDKKTTFNESAEFYKATTFDEKATFNKKTTFNESTEFYKQVTFREKTKFDETAEFNKKTTFNESTESYAQSTFQSTATFKKSVTFDNQVTHNDAITFNQKATFKGTSIHDDTETYNAKTIYNDSVEFYKFATFDEEVRYRKLVRYARKTIFDDQATFNESVKFYKPATFTGSVHFYNPVTYQPQAPATFNESVEFYKAVTFSGATGPSASETARITNTAAQSIPNNALTTVNFNTETWDSNNLHSTVTNTGRLTAAVAGTYLIVAGGSFAANATGTRRFLIIRNGTDLYNDSVVINSGASAGVNQTVTDMVDLAKDDYVEFQVSQDSGGNLNLTNQTFSLARIANKYP